MVAVISAFLKEPVLFLGVLVAGSTTALSEGLISGPVAIVAVVVLTALQRQFVSPKGIG